MKQFTIGRVGLVLLATAAICLSQAAVASASAAASAQLVAVERLQLLDGQPRSDAFAEGLAVEPIRVLDHI
jgi:hypothetical protein